ncbi:TPA: tail fiber protein, partial [Yersinia enterocolitica]|nr:tail fiber protein [Yersinia enterocolitica]HED0394601.1 tail fiber protein [Yersinia enterocolitica]
MANEILPFGLGAESNVMTQAEYEALAARSSGFSSGVAKSEQLNKVWRQSSFMASVLADFIAARSGNDVLDNGNTATLLASLELAIKEYANSNLPVASTLQQGITKLSSLTNSSSETLAATLKAVKTVSDEGLKITGNLAEIKAAGPAAIAEAQSNLDLAALLGDALQKANNLSEIKDAGPAAVAQTLLNLGLGDAAKRSVGTGVNQIPDMSSFISSFAQNGYFKFPGGLIIQWGEVTGSTTGTVPTNFPIPFPNALMSTALAIDLIGPSYATLQNQTLGGISVNTWNSAGNRAALAIRYIA